MNYKIIELQTNTNPETGIRVTGMLDYTETDLNQALFTFLTKAGYAAISNNEVAAVILLTEDGRLVRTPEVFRHTPVVAQEPELEETPEEPEPSGGE